MQRGIGGIVVLFGLLSGAGVHADGWQTTGYYNATNVGSIINTGHNLSPYYAPMRGFMLSYMNDYQEVCVYCHTPHGASTQNEAPIWNRTESSATYIQTTNTLAGTPVGQPGRNSLTCLSCHDGSVAIDSIINMPGSGKYSAAQMTSVNTAFLNSWTGPGGGGTASHTVMGPNQVTHCTRCHNNDGLGLGLSSFEAFLLGTNLSNDHVVGTRYPTSFGPGTDFFAPTVSVPGKMAYFDSNSNGRPDNNEIRLYDTGDGFEVECASCHDPHGVRMGGPGSPLVPSFMRVSNTSSSLCRTCHDK